MLLDDVEPDHVDVEVERALHVGYGDGGVVKSEDHASLLN